MRLKFKRFYQLVDSEPSVTMLGKFSTRFKVYEGVQIGEIQVAPMTTSHFGTEWIFVDIKII